MKFLIVDAFTETTFGGNPAGVVILDKNQEFPDNEIMRKTAAELRYSETAFIRQIGHNEFNIRYFTPAAEVDLCGHATIASFFAMLQKGIIKNNSKCINHTLAGILEIDIKNGFVMMDMATPVLISTIKDAKALDELYQIMGINYTRQFATDTTGKKIELFPQLISTGLPDILMSVSTLDDLASIKPNMAALSDLSAKYKVTGVHAFTLNTKEKDTTAHCRNFAPLYDIDEEAATGTSNGALTYYLKINNIINASDSCKIIQGEAMNRPSIILTQIEADDQKSKIKVGGSAVILAEGEINI